MAQECTESSVAISPSIPLNWWDLHHANSLSSLTNTSPWHQSNPSSNSSCEEDLSMSTSFTNASNHSGLTVESARQLVEPASSTELMGEHAYSQLWSHILLGIGSNEELDNSQDVGENLLDAFSSKTSSTMSSGIFGPSCDYFKRMDNNWEFTNPTSFNNFDKHLNGFSESLIGGGRFNKLVSPLSIAPPNPEVRRQLFDPLTCNISLSPSVNHDYSGQHQSTYSNSTTCLMGESRNSDLQSCYGHDLKVENEHRERPTAPFRRPFNSNGVGYHIGLNSSVVGDNSKYYHGMPDATNRSARNFADALTFSNRLRKPLIDIQVPKPCFKSINLSDSRNQGLQTSSPTGKGHGTTNERKRRRSEETSETAAKKAKHESSTVSSVKIQAPKVKLSERVTALQQIVSPFGRLFSSPCMKTTNSHKDPWGGLDRKDKGDARIDLRSRGLCLVPISCTPQIYHENAGSDYWTPTYRECLYRVCYPPLSAMKRDFDEISDDEWANHSFKPSRILTTTQNGKHKSNSSSSASFHPPLESFAFKKPQQNSFSSVVDDCVQVTEHFNLEDDDVEEEEETARPSAVNRGRRFVVDDDDDDEDEEVQERERGGDLAEVYDIKSSDEEWEEEGLAVEDDDLVGKALQKCSKISVELKRELYGSGVTSCDRYAEVEASSVKIVTQDDIDAACAVADSDFQPVLKPYQLVGVNFLLLLHRKGIGGAILADEMGLGKTIQAITYLTLLKYLHNDPGPHLIVCPASLLENWERELKKWCPSFSVLQYHGAMRSAYSKELGSLAKAGLPPPFNVLLVCYSLFERHSAQQKDDRKILKRWQWSCVIMDEAHALKDKNSYRWKNLMSVARNANQRLMLTGTPLQNDLHELWSLLEFMMPDLFATEDEDLKKLLNAEDGDLIGRMKSILGPFILRRLKSDVMQQLVPKIQRVEYVSMEKHQEYAYKEAIEEYRAVSHARIAKVSDGDPNTIVGVLPRRQISNYFVQFRKIANHPLLVRRIYSDEDVIRFAKKLHPMGAFGFECTLERVIEELKSYSDFSIHRLLLYHDINEKKGILSDKYVMLSAKCRALAELLPDLKKCGHRVLIFSQWTSMLDILEWTLDVLGVTYRRLDGRFSTILI
ncbi:hypothetical protein NC653_025075 [Populus alba x Populus x berolinensis]|uniref:Helicase ATP-binding domain-containing protein n=1 Tax=Populus alba x Populus x berolinensis TaxID=444605 RepID=A0AAD6MAF1_9ROSI|nr:hypothetical protein NC653_025075 [Populus alba x Populus x berolinensis]